MGKIKIMIMVVIAIAAVTLLAVSGTAKVKKPPKFIPVGYALSLTGHHANMGKYYKDAYELAVNQVNKEGGIYIKKYNKKIPIKLLGYDDESKPEKCVSLYEKLISLNGCPVVLGPYSSTIVFSVIPVCEKNRVPVIQGGGSSEKSYRQGWKMVHGVLPSTEHYADAVWDFLGSLPDEEQPKRIAVLQEDSLVGESVVAGCKREAAKQGIEMVVIGSFPRNVKDMSPIVAKALRAGADAIMSTGHFYGDSLMILNLRERKTNLKLEWVLVSVGMSDFFETLGQKGNYVMGYGCFHPESKFSQKFNFTQEYTRYAGRQPDYHAALGYAAAQVLIQALKDAQSMKSAEILKATNRMNTDTVLGPMSFKENGMPEKMPILLLQHQAKHGEEISWDTLEVVWPPEAQTAKPVYPKPSTK